MADRERYLTEIDAALAALGVAETAHDVDGSWGAARDVLSWLYNAEENERAADPAYYAGRDATGEGRTLAGLMWVRGLVVHRQAEVRVAIWKPVKIHRADDDGNWQPVALHRSAGDGTWVPAQAYVSAAAWPARSELPPGRREQHGRDVHYDQHVAGSAFMAPLMAAREYISHRG